MYVPEVSELEMHWVSEGGHLRSQWSATSRPNQFEAAEVRSTHQLRAIPGRTASVKAETSWLVGMLCWLIAFLFGVTRVVRNSSTLMIDVPRVLRIPNAEEKFNEPGFTYSAIESNPLTN
jgi:hypothetical protein